MHSPDSSEISLPRPPWGPHALALIAAIALFFLGMMSTTSDSLNRIFLFLFMFAPMSLAYAAVSTGLVWLGFRQHPEHSTRRTLLAAHGIALVVGVIAAFAVASMT